MADSTTSYSIELSHVLQDLREKFKHGEHITRILEGQLETAQQNISLLQGQVRLANETIDNLKQQFKSSENAVFFLLENGDRLAKDMSLKVNVHDKEQCSHLSDSNNQDEQMPSPKSVIILQKDGSQEYIMSSSTSVPQGSSEKPKSPYAQQLRQVLDILQNEEPSKKTGNISSSYCQSAAADDYQPNCHCPDCAGSSGHSHTPTSGGQLVCKSLSCTCSYHMSNNSSQSSEREKAKVTTPWCSSSSLVVNSQHTMPNDMMPVNGDIRLLSVGQRGQPVQHMTSRSSPLRPNSHNQCECTSSDTHNKYKMMERGHSSSFHCSTPCSDVSLRHGDDNPHHSKGGCSSDDCTDHCGCHSYTSYAAPYGYQVLDSASVTPHGMPRSNSPGRKRKRLPTVLQLEDPPHLKYTKVKRIDGSKLTAQKTLADFSKRRYLPCNPRYDLDLLIVPPPLSAAELLEPGKQALLGKTLKSSVEHHRPVPTEHQATIVLMDKDCCSDNSNTYSISDQETASQGKDVVNTFADSPGSNTSYITEDNHTVLIENNNVHIANRSHLLVKPQVCDLPNGKLPHFIPSMPPSLSTQS